MKPDELTVDQAIVEIEKIIQLYPDRLGGEMEEDGSLSCSYFLDERGCPVGSIGFTNKPQELVTPVCIIGQWIETFHPEWKENSFINHMLRTNQLISTFAAYDKVFATEVREVLGEIQGQQDDARRWVDIEIPDVN